MIIKRDKGYYGRFILWLVVDYVWCYITFLVVGTISYLLTKTPIKIPPFYLPLLAELLTLLGIFLLTRQLPQITLFVVRQKGYIELMNEQYINNKEYQKAGDDKY